MFWKDLSIKEKSDLMRLYISNGIMDLDSIKKHYNSFATGGTLPDHDPNNPYHYHDAEGNKVVISPEDWEANVGKPYFREIEAAVKAEQAAYPELEYEVNPAFMRDLNSSVAAARGQNGMINYAGYRNQLPQGYTINENGIIFDDKGQAYVQESYPQSTRFTYNTDSPLQFTFNQGKPIERNVNFYPVNMDMRVKEPLPVDRILDVNDERENAIKTIQDNLVYRTSLENILPGFEGGMMVGNTPLYYDFSSKNNHKEFIKKYLENITGTPVTFIKYNDDYDNIVELNKEQLDTITKNSKLYYDKLNAEQIEKIKKDLLKASPNDFRTKKEYDEHVDVDNKYIQSLSDYINSSDFYYDYPEDRPKPYKLSRKEAEKKAVISIDPLEKTKTFEEGGPINNKSDWVKTHEVELALHQLGWDNPDNRLHSDYAAKDDNGYYAGYNLKPVTIKAEHPIRQWDKTISLDSPYLKDLYQHYLNREEAGKEYLNNIGRVGLTVGTLPLLGYGLAAAPLTTGLSVLGGEGLNYGVKKLTPYQSWGNLLAQGVFNTDNELVQTALEFTNPGFLLGPKAAIYNKGVQKRIADVLLREGDVLMNHPIKAMQNVATNRKALNYIFNPRANPNDVYNLGDWFRYNGTEGFSGPMMSNSEVIASEPTGYPGDVIDLFLGKNLDKASFKIAENYPEGISDYTYSRYGIKKPRVYDIGIIDEKANLTQTESFGLHKDGQPVLDPGGHVTYGQNNIGSLHYDIWKYNPKDFMKRWAKDDWPLWKKIAARKMTSFIDRQGEPIAHIWTQPWESDITTDSPAFLMNKKFNWNITDKDLKYALGKLPNEIHFLQGGSLGHITPYGQWEYPNEVTTIPSNNITMKGVDYPVIGVSDTGDTKYMLPNMDYIFDGQYVTEYPINK